MRPSPPQPGVTSERFFVTGATGALGAWVVKLLLSEGVDVTAFGDFADDHRLRLVAAPNELLRLHRVEGRTTEAESIREGMAGASHVVHLHGVGAGDCDQDPAGAAAEAVIGTANVFAVAQAVGIVGVAFESSMSVFSPRDAQVGARESADPSSRRGLFHRANELVAEGNCGESGPSTIGLRLGLVYGPGQDHGDLSIPTIAIAAAVDGTAFHMPYGGMADFQFIRDVAAAFIRAARASTHRAAIVNLRGAPCPIQDFLRSVGTLTGAEDLTSGGAVFPLPVAAIDPAAAELFGDHATTSISSGIRETLEILRWSPRDLYRAIL